MTDRLPYYFITVPLVFVCSAAASALIEIIIRLLQHAYRQIREFIKLQREREDKHKWQDYLFAALMFGALIFAFWKCSYGFGGNDEAFYLTVAHRLGMGDALISDEWHLSQLSGFLMMPFVWLYTTIMQSTEGIILAARILYIIFHAAVSIVIYVRLRKYGYITVFASVLYFIFTPYNIMAMSYNTMGLDLITLTGVIMGTTSYKKKLPLIISGLTLAGAVLCCPYLAAAYVLYGICVIIHTVIKKKNLNIVFSSELFSVKTFLFFSIGVVALAAVFLIFMLSRTSLSEIFEYLPYLMSDPEHPQISVLRNLQLYFNSILNCHTHFKIPLFTYLAMLVVMIIDRKRKQHRAPYLIVTIAVVVFCYFMFISQLTSVYYNAIMFPLIFVGITSYILCDNKPKPLFASLFVLGIIYSAAISFSSNQYFYVISMAMTASNVASYVFLAQLVREMKTSQDSIEYARWVKRASFVFAAFMIFLQGALQIKAKAEHCFWEWGGISSLTEEISSGPAKGIYTTAGNCATYETIYQDLEYYKSKTKDNILFLTEKTWCYLAADYPYGTYSAWLSGEKESSIERLKTYYSLNPDKIPRYIYIPKDSAWDFSTLYSDAWASGYSIEENDVSYKLEKVK